MKVILKTNVKNVGKMGDVVDVSDGYANNFLLKQKLAVPANSENLHNNETQKKLQAKQKADSIQANKELAEKLSNVEVRIKVTAGKNDQLFGSVTSKEIAEQLDKMGIIIDKKKVVLDSPIKSKGQYVVIIKLCPEVTAKAKVIVE